MEQQKFFITSPVKSPFKDGCVISKDNFYNSPIKLEPTIFSPFKNSSLSPFKLMNQSPSIGSFDEWDKDFMASFEEKLFGISDISDDCDDPMMSPHGKALLENRISPNRTNSVAVRQLKISSGNRQRNMSQNFQALHDQSSGVFCLPVHATTESVDMCTVNKVKDENIECDQLYDQHNLVYINSYLSVVDPDKMSATPIKPYFTNVDSAPVRRLTMKVVEGRSTVFGGCGTTPNIQGTNILYDKPMQQDQCLQHYEWPVKEKLKYARLQFQEILNKAVDMEIEILKKEKQRKIASKNIKHSKHKGNGVRTNVQFVQR